MLLLVLELLTQFGVRLEMAWGWNAHAGLLPSVSGLLTTYWRTAASDRLGGQCESHVKASATVQRQVDLEAAQLAVSASSAARSTGSLCRDAWVEPSARARLSSTSSARRMASA